MNLLFDQNLSHKLVVRLKSIFPDSTHVKFHDLSNKSDLAVWDFATKNNYTIVSQDSDFLEISLLKGYPPKIIWIRSGNTSTDAMELILKDHYLTIKNFINSAKGYCLELD